MKLVAARARDTNLNLAVSDFSGEIDFYDVEGSGLSTTVASHAEMYATPEPAERIASSAVAEVRCSPRRFGLPAPW